MQLNKLIISLLVIFTIIILLFLLRNTLLKIIYPKKYSEYIEKYAQIYNVDKHLIYAIVKVESDFNPNAISNKGAIGLMQLMDTTAYDMANKINIKIDRERKNKLFDIDLNINIGTKYISYLIDKYKNIELSIAAYNAGIGNIDSWISLGKIKSDGTDIENVPFKETNIYVRKVLRSYKIYNKIYR